MAITYFAATDATHGNGLWKTDGSEAGTQLLVDLNPGAASANPHNFIFVNGTLYFVATGDTGGPDELWKTDGTAAGTVPVTDINPGTGSSNISNLVHFNGTPFFTADDR